MQFSRFCEQNNIVEFFGSKAVVFVSRLRFPLTTFEPSLAPQRGVLGGRLVNFAFKIYMWLIHKISKPILIQTEPLMG